MNRNTAIASLADTPQWDFIVIGGGASGLGTALDAASRGYKTLLLEKSDFAQGTSSRSTKLVHGGIRYLRQGYFSLVHEALYERSLLRQNAPHLVHPIPFLLPAKDLCRRLYYFAGTKLYDLLSTWHSFGSSFMVSKQRMHSELPTLKPSLYSGGVCYYDGQFDDARLAINLAQTIFEQGGSAINYMPVTALLKNNGKIAGVVATDLESGRQYEIFGKTVINATGVFVDSVRMMDTASSEPLVVASQGSHIVLDRSFFPTDYALIIPETPDGRVLFAIPWHNYVVIGTTEIERDHIDWEPTPIKSEISYLLENIGKYLTVQPYEKDILSTFAGLRPLVKPEGKWKSTSSLPREYLLTVEPSQLITLTGGKWTTYRAMAEKTIDKALQVAGLPFKKSRTKQLPIHGSANCPSTNNERNYYGSDLPAVDLLAKENPKLNDRLHADLSCRGTDVIWAVRHEMARKIEDVLSRRNRSLILNAKASQMIAPQVASLMAQELGFDASWQKKELAAYQSLVKQHLV